MAHFHSVMPTPHKKAPQTPPKRAAIAPVVCFTIGICLMMGAFCTRLYHWSEPCFIPSRDHCRVSWTGTLIADIRLSAHWLMREIHFDQSFTVQLMTFAVRHTMALWMVIGR